VKIGYARVSTEEQNLDMQLTALRKAKCTKIFEEKQSGASRNRPELNKMLEILRPGDVIVVWKLDRLARSTIMSGARLCRLESNRGAALNRNRVSEESA
jgi:DNA invertase Pin-like site-specific DNA recombinase